MITDVPHNITIQTLGTKARAVCSCGWSRTVDVFERLPYMITSTDDARNDPQQYAKSLASRHLAQHKTWNTSLFGYDANSDQVKKLRDDNEGGGWIVE